MSTRLKVMLLVALTCISLMFGAFVGTGTASAHSAAPAASRIPHLVLKPAEVELNKYGCVSFTIIGKNYLPSSPVFLAIQNVGLGEAFTDTNGRFSEPVTDICGLSPGKYTVTGIDEADLGGAVAVLHIVKED